MTRIDDIILAQAASWHAASEQDEMDWDGFTEWLEADERHRAAYDEVALADALVAEHRGSLHAAIANDDDDDEADHAPVVVRPAFPHWKRWAGAAIAATLVAVLAVPQFMASSPVVYETAAGARTIALDDGSSVILAPHSRLTMDGRHHERMALSGGGWFDIRHDPARQLTIQAGGTTISDIGTRFDVQAGEGRVRVEVAQGTVQVSAAALSQPVKLAAGKSVLFDAAAGTAVIRPVRQADTGEWRVGRLTYDSVPLSLVKEDLSRYAGVDLTMPADIGDRRFSGTLALGHGQTAIRDLAQVMDLDVRRDADGYHLQPR